MMNRLTFDHITMATLVVIVAFFLMECMRATGASGAATDQTRVIATAPVNPVKVGGIMSLHCQVWNIPEHSHVSLFGTLNGEMGKLAENEFVLPSIEDRVFLSVRRMEDSSSVYFLSITDVTTLDGGIFTCRVTISHNQKADELVDFDSIELRIYHVPVEPYPLCSTSSSQMPVKVGTFIRMNCTSQNGNPPVNMEWSRTGEGSLPALPRKVPQGDMSYSILEFKVSTKEHNAMFICTISSDMFPEFQRTCHVGPLQVESEPNNGGVNPGILPPTVSYGLTTAQSKDNHVTPRIITRQDCLATCEQNKDSQVFLWIITTTVAATLALIFFTIGMILLIRYYRLHSSPGVNYSTPGGKTFHPQSRTAREDTYAELERKPSDKQFYMALEIKEHLENMPMCPAINDLVVERQYTRGPVN